MAGMYDLIPHFSSFQRRLASTPQMLAFSVCTRLPWLLGAGTRGVILLPLGHLISVAVADEVLRRLEAQWGWHSQLHGLHRRRPVSILTDLSGRVASVARGQLCQGSSFLSSCEKGRRCIWWAAGQAASQKLIVLSPKATQPANKRYFLVERLHSKPTEMS